MNLFRQEYGTDNKPFEIHATTADAFSIYGVKKLQDLGVTECVIGFRDSYKGEQDTKTLEQKLAMLQWFADSIIAKTAN